MEKRVRDMILNQRIPPWIVIDIIIGRRGTKEDGGEFIDNRILGIPLTEEKIAEALPEYIESITTFLRKHDSWTPSNHFLLPNFLKTNIIFLRTWWKQGKFLQGCPEEFLLQLFSEITKEAKYFIKIYVWIWRGHADMSARPAPHPHCMVEFWTNPHDRCPLCKRYEAITARNNKAYVNDAEVCPKCSSSFHRCIYCGWKYAGIVPPIRQGDGTKLCCIHCLRIYSVNLPSVLSAIVKE